MIWMLRGKKVTPYRLFLFFLMGIIGISCANALSFSDYFTELKETNADMFDAYAIFTLHNPTNDNLVLDASKFNAYFVELSNGVSEWKYFIKVPVEYEKQRWIQNLSCENITENNTISESCIDNGHNENFTETIYEFHEFNSTIVILPDESYDIKFYAKYYRSAFITPVSFDWIAIVKDNTGWLGLWDNIYESENWTWFNVSWNKKQSIIFNATTNITNFTIGINVTYDADMLSDYSDLRFTWYNTTSLSEQSINYFIENYTTSYAYVWLKAPVINGTYYMYYQNTSAVNTTSDGFLTFVLFDDFNSASFNTTKWTNETTANQTAGVYCITGNFMTYSSSQFARNNSWVIKGKLTGSGSQIGGINSGATQYSYITRFDTFSTTNFTASTNTGSESTKLLGGLDLNYNRYMIKPNITNSSIVNYNQNYGAFLNSTTDKIIAEGNYNMLAVRTWAGVYACVDYIFVANNSDKISSSAFGSEESGNSISFSTQSPANNTIINDANTIHFNSTVQSKASATMSCNFSINGTLNQTNASVYNNTLVDFTASLQFGYYNWTMNCWNDTTSNSTTSNFLLNNTNTISFSTQSPANNTIITTSGNINFKFTAISKTSSAMNCSLYINGSLNQSGSATNNTLKNFVVAIPNGTSINWNVTCQNGTITNTTPLYYLSTNWATSYTIASEDDTTGITIEYSPIVSVGENAEIKIMVHAPDNYTSFNWTYHGKGMITDSAFTGSGAFMTTGGASISDANGCPGFCLMSGDYEGDYDYTGDTIATFEFVEKPKDDRDTCMKLGGCVCGTGDSAYCAIPCECVRKDPRHEPTPSDPIDSTPPSDEIIWKDSEYTFYVHFNNNGYYPFYITATGIDSVTNESLLLYSNGGKIIVGSSMTYINDSATSESTDNPINVIVVYGFLIAFVIGSGLYLFARRD